MAVLYNKDDRCYKPRLKTLLKGLQCTFLMSFKAWHFQGAAPSLCSDKREKNSLHVLLTSGHLFRFWSELGNNGRPIPTLQSRSHILPPRSENEQSNLWPSFWTWPITSFSPAGVICVMWITIVPLNLLTYSKWVTALKYPLYSQILCCGWHGNHTGWLNMGRGDRGGLKLKKGPACLREEVGRGWCTLNIGKWWDLYTPITLRPTQTHHPPPRSLPFSLMQQAATPPPHETAWA